ncbi:MAG: hypothetical protein WCE80_15240 [Acidimicrobiia bacterium]
MPGVWRPVITVVLTCFGLAMPAYRGIADSDGLHGLILLAPIAGVMLGGVGGARLAGQLDRSVSRTV